MPGAIGDGSWVAEGDKNPEKTLPSEPGLAPAAGALSVANLHKVCPLKEFPLTSRFSMFRITYRGERNISHLSVVCQTAQKIAKLSSQVGSC